MANYVFEELLSPLDFEHLVQDLLSEDLGFQLTAFAEGRDGGIDLRYSCNKKKNIVVQCKRVKTISRKQLEEEAKKLKKLKLEVYYLVFSSDLSVGKFDMIKEIFGEWISSDKNIYQRNRLNDLLDKHETIHRKHYKLWLNSANVFNNIINQPLFERANALVTTIKKNYKYYVKNESLGKAIEILNKNQFIIISGIPGIGKTTLARLLLWEYLLQGFEIIEIRKILEGEQMLVENTHDKQVYYFDDFLGENFLKYDVIEGRSNDIVQFIQRIMNNKNKVLIMTTREYILHQAKEKYEKLNTNEFDIYKYTLDLSTYSKKIKALILYNHLYYSGISHDHVKDILITKSYKAIINHPNYSPRIIEQMTVYLKEVPAKEYSKTFLENLNHPFGIWDKAFNSQISPQSKFILFVLLSIGELVLLSDFKLAVYNFFKCADQNLHIQFNKFDLKIYLKELEGCFIKFEITQKRNHFVDFQNPSIKDFLLHLVREDKELISQLLESIIYFEQLIYTVNYLSIKYQDDIQLNKQIGDIIINKFEIFDNKRVIYGKGGEYEKKLSVIDKLSKLIPFLKNSNNGDLLNFILNKFYSIDIKGLDNIQEKKYIRFIKSFKDNLAVNFRNLITTIFNKISWFDNVQNFFSIRELDEKTFDAYVLENKSALEEKITNTIDKEIEFYETKEELDDLSLEISSTSEVIENITNINMSFYDKIIDEKIQTINLDSKTKKEITELDFDDYERDNDEIEFNEDEFFKDEFFEY